MWKSMLVTGLLVFGSTVFGLMTDAVGADSKKTSKKGSPIKSEIQDARFTLFPKVGGLNWAVKIDRRTGNTWRLGSISNGKGGHSWKWVPIDTCENCR